MRWFSRAKELLVRPHADTPAQSMVCSCLVPPRQLRLTKQFQSDVGVMLHMYDEDIHAGKLAYAVCEHCRIGHVLQLSVYAGYDGSGVGRALVNALLATFPTLTWYTTWQQ